MRQQHLTRRGAHRGAHNPLAALIPSLLAVAAVAAMITALSVWRSGEPTQPAASATGRTPSATAPSTTAASPTPSETPPPGDTSTPTESSPAPEDLRGTREVVVLNQTSRTGLAAQVADQLRGQGWTVAAVGNFRGVVPATTVYYPAGTEDVASVLADDLPTPPRTKPRFGNLSETRLTVVVTDNYPG